MAKKYIIIDPEKLTYDKALEKIQTIVSLLDNDQLDLNKALKYYQESAELIEYCQNQIHIIETEVKKIKIINKNDDINNLNE